MGTRDQARLRAQVRWAKELLSVQPVVEFPVVLPSGSRVVALERHAAEALLRPLVLDSVEVARRTLADAGAAPNDLHGVLLVGGASRLPLVAQLLREGFPGVRLLRPDDPKAAVAVGAARMAIEPELVASAGLRSQGSAPATLALASAAHSPEPLEVPLGTPLAAGTASRRWVVRVRLQRSWWLGCLRRWYRARGGPRASPDAAGSAAAASGSRASVSTTAQAPTPTNKQRTDHGGAHDR